MKRRLARARILLRIRAEQAPDGRFNGGTPMRYLNALLAALPHLPFAEDRVRRDRDAAWTIPA
jgi:hypothetical protein